MHQVMTKVVSYNYYYVIHLASVSLSSFFLALLFPCFTCNPLSAHLPTAPSTPLFPPRLS